MGNLTGMTVLTLRILMCKIYKFMNISILKTCAPILCIFVGKGQGSTCSCYFCNGWYNHVLYYIFASEKQIITFAHHDRFSFNTKYATK